MQNKLLLCYSSKNDGVVDIYIVECNNENEIKRIYFNLSYFMDGFPFVAYDLDNFNILGGKDAIHRNSSIGQQVINFLSELNLLV